MSSDDSRKCSSVRFQLTTYFGASRRARLRALDERPGVVKTWCAPRLAPTSRARDRSRAITVSRVQPPEPRHHDRTDASAAPRSATIDSHHRPRGCASRSNRIYPAVSPSGEGQRPGHSRASGGDGGDPLIHQVVFGVRHRRSMHPRTTPVPRPARSDLLGHTAWRCRRTPARMALASGRLRAGTKP